MKTILSLTERNMCFTRLQAVLSEPKLRRRVFETLGGAPAIASGEYIPPAAGYDGTPQPVKRISSAPPIVKKPASAPRPMPVSVPAPAPRPYLREFRLPALRNLRYVHRPAPAQRKRRPGVTRRLCTVLWPHELDGQYVPNFKSRARMPGGGYGTYANAADTQYAGQKIAGAPP